MELEFNNYFFLSVILIILFSLAVLLLLLNEKFKANKQHNPTAPPEDRRGHMLFILIR